MAKYISLMTWTEQGVRNVRDTVHRAEQAKGALAQAGVTLEHVFWIQGRYDLVAILDAPDDATVAAAVLQLAMAGNLRTEMMRAFTAEEMGGIIAQIG